MLPFAVMVLVVAYLVLDRSGVIDDIVAAVSKRKGRTGPRTLEIPPRSGVDKETDRRLEVFQNFIEQLQSQDDEEEDSP